MYNVKISYIFGYVTALINLALLKPSKILKMDKSTSSSGRCILCLTVCIAMLFSCRGQEKANGISAYADSAALAVFAPELAVEGNTYKGSFSDDFNTFYFFRRDSSKKEKYIPYVSHFKDGKWQTPYLSPYFKAEQSYTYQLNVPHSDQLIFIADLRTKNDQSESPNYNFWSIEKSKIDQAQAVELGPQKLITHYNSQPCITNKETIYFSSYPPDWSKQQAYQMEKKDGHYGEPVLFEPVEQWRSNSDWKVGPFAVAPDESYLVASIQDLKTGNRDLYLSTKKNEEWTSPKKLGADINTQMTEAFPYVTADGKYLLFTRGFSQFFIIPTALLF